MSTLDSTSRGREAVRKSLSSSSLGLTTQTTTTFSLLGSDTFLIFFSSPPAIEKDHRISLSFSSKMSSLSVRANAKTRDHFQELKSPILTKSTGLPKPPTQILELEVPPLVGDTEKAEVHSFAATRSKPELELKSSSSEIFFLKKPFYHAHTRCFFKKMLAISEL